MPSYTIELFATVVHCFSAVQYVVVMSSMLVYTYPIQNKDKQTRAAVVKFIILNNFFDTNWLIHKIPFLALFASNAKLLLYYTNITHVFTPPPPPISYVASSH